MDICGHGNGYFDVFLFLWLSIWMPFVHQVESYKTTDEISLNLTVYRVFTNGAWVTQKTMSHPDGS